MSAAMDRALESIERIQELDRAIGASITGAIDNLRNQLQILESAKELQLCASDPEVDLAVTSAIRRGRRALESLEAVVR